MGTIVDVLIVGSGPAGISTALHLVQTDPAWANRVLVVDRATHPRDKLCGGGVTHMGENVLARLGYRLEPRHFPVREVRLVYGEQSYSFLGNPVIKIVRRAEFDHWLVGLARARGIQVCEGEAVLDVAVSDDQVTVQTERRTIVARILVAADGARSTVRRRLKWEDAPHPVTRVARLLEVITPEDPMQDPGFRQGVAVFDFSRLTDRLQGYYWDFPSYVDGRPYMNRGVFDSRARPERPREDLRQALRESLADRNRTLDDFELKGHPIRWYHRTTRLSRPRVLLAGDAAGVDPLFGEGISLALGYGDVAAQAIADAFHRQDFRFADYRRRVYRHWLLWQLPIRARIARVAYLLHYPRLVRLGWHIARIVIRFTRWRNPDFVPVEAPRLVVRRTAAS